jgi:substrate-binding family protein
MRAIPGFLVILTAAAIATGSLVARAGETPVKIGVLSDMSSLYADIGGQGSVEAARMAIDDFGGKVLGQPIELVSADQRNKPDVGAEIARRWYDEDGVDVITDVPTSSVALAGRHELVLHHRRICLRPCPGARHRGGRQGRRGHGVGRSPRPAQQRGFLVLFATSAGVEGEGHRTRQRRRRYDQFRYGGLTRPRHRNPRI